IMDYEHRNTWEIIGMGISYSLSRNYIRKAERIADAYAVNRGMGAYLVAKKGFILDHTKLPQVYRAKIEALYPSPEDIEELMADLESENNEEHMELPPDHSEAVYPGKPETRGESVPGNS